MELDLKVVSFKNHFPRIFLLVNLFFRFAFALDQLGTLLNRTWTMLRKRLSEIASWTTFLHNIYLLQNRKLTLGWSFRPSGQRTFLSKRSQEIPEINCPAAITFQNRFVTVLRIYWIIYLRFSLTTKNDHVDWTNETILMKRCRLLPMLFCVGWKNRKRKNILKILFIFLLGNEQRWCHLQLTNTN